MADVAKWSMRQKRRRGAGTERQGGRIGAGGPNCPQPKCRGGEEDREGGPSGPAKLTIWPLLGDLAGKRRNGQYHQHNKTRRDGSSAPEMNEKSPAESCENPERGDEQQVVHHAHCG